MFSLHSALVVAGLELTDANTVIGKAYMAGLSCKLLSVQRKNLQEMHFSPDN